MEIKLNLKQAGVLAIAAVAALSVQARGGKRLSEYVNPFIGATTNTQMLRPNMGWKDLSRCGHAVGHDAGQPQYHYRRRQRFGVQL